jgi:hypothetical protein
VSLTLWPSNAHRLVIEAAARTLDRMASALGELLAGLTPGLDTDALHRIQDGIGRALMELDAVGQEAERERLLYLAPRPDLGPLLRTLLRLRHDLVIIGRAAVVPLPEALASRLASPLARTGTAASDYLRASAATLLAGGEPPPLDDVEAGLDAYAVAVAKLREEGLTRNLPGDAAERFFALGFALEQLHQNFNDLGRCVIECARPSPALSGTAR